MYLPHLASRLYGMPLLLARTKLEIILSALGERVGWATAQADSSTLPSSVKLARADASQLLNLSQELSISASGIAVIGVTGSLVRKNIGVEAQSGLMSYAEISQKLELAAADASVSGILLEIDSPGGEAGGVFELAQRIREINAIKPVWALACDSAFSAAYAIACAASRVLVTQTSGLGSIGVIAMHVDQTARDAQQGYRFTAVTAGDYKGDLSTHEAINKGALARLQAEVDRLYGLFVEHVASMRAMAAKSVRTTQAACFFGPESIDVGLADALVRADQVIPEFAAYLSQNRFQRHASQVISNSTGAFAGAANQAPLPHASLPDSPTVVPTVPHLSTVKPKEILMTQDLQPKTAPVPEKLADTPALPTANTPAVDVPHAPTAPVPKTEPLQSDSPEPRADTGRAQALEIAELCQLAGQSGRIASFLAQGTTAGQVRQALLLARTQSEEISSLIHPDASKPAAKAPNGDAAALLAAVKKLTSTS